ncbi:MAG: molybdopterin converting factor subunit 1 [Herpetosiphonaceae bacterium]|nr:molybdopterin converting factor subunit 1 [Herpetosiphonaceae bacterium]
MQITVRFFAQHRDIVGAPELRYEVADGSSVGGVWAQLGREYPRLAAMTGSLLYAVNQEYADPATVIHEGDEVAFIPPVSGGSDWAPFVVTAEPLDGGPLQQYIATPDDGAVVLFTGMVRNNFGGRATDHLVYEAYREMAEPVLAQIAEEARSRYEIGRVAVHHRIGQLQIGETAVLVAVGAPHRHAAFEAAEYIMDRIKEIAPIWKREHWADGAAEWIGHEHERLGEL